MSETVLSAKLLMAKPSKRWIPPSDETMAQICPGWKKLRRGTEYLILDPFTPNERSVLADSEEGRAWKAAHPPTGKPLRITAIDYEKRSITLSA